MSRKTKSQMVAALALGTVLFNLAPAQAATITYLGQDQTTVAGWRNTTVTKPAALLGGTAGVGDPNGDKVYGSDGYYVRYAPGATTLVSSLPGYISGVADAGTGHYGDGSYGLINDPTVVGGLPSKPAGIFYYNSGNVEYDFLTLTLAADNTFVMGVIGGTWGPDGHLYNFNRLRVRQVVGGAADSTLQTVALLTTPSYDFFQISGVAGDQFTLSAEHVTGTSYGVSISGITFEAVSIPEPASIALLAVGGVLMLFRGRRQQM